MHMLRGGVFSTSNKMLAVTARGLLTVTATALLVLIGLRAPASAQEPSIPVIVQTRPQIPGARFALDGVEFVADEHGLALTTVPTPGVYELAISSPTIEVEGATHAFSGWTGGEHASSRPLEVRSFTLLEAGFNTTRDISFRFTDQSGTAIEPSRVDHATIVESDGDNSYRINGDQPTRVMATRAVPLETGVALQPASYRLVEAVVDGKQVYGSETEIKVGLDRVVGISVALPAAPREVPAEPGASAARPVDEGAEPMPWGVLAILIGLLSGLFTVVSGFWLWRANLGGLAGRWGALLAPLESKRWARRPAGGPGDAGKQLPERVDTEWPLEVDHHLRVHMKSGRIIDGWTRPISQTIDNQVLTLFRVEIVYDQNGNEVVNSPQDVFLLRSQVERIEHIDASADPPPVIEPPAEVITLEENNVEETKTSGQEAVDLRETTSVRQTHRQWSKDRFG
jgi:hypothetical protein